MEKWANKVELIRFLRTEAERDGAYIGLKTAKDMADQLWPYIATGYRVMDYAEAQDKAEEALKEANEQALRYATELGHALNADERGVTVVWNGATIEVPAGSTIKLGE